MGYYTRVKGLEHLLDKVILRMVGGPEADPDSYPDRPSSQTQKQIQIINLGAGFDTLYWRLRQKWKKVRGVVVLENIEIIIDFRFPLLSFAESSSWSNIKEFY